MRRRRGSGGASGAVGGIAACGGPGGTSSVSTSGMVGGFNGPGERTAGTGLAGRGDAGLSTTYLFSSPRSFRPRVGQVCNLPGRRGQVTNLPPQTDHTTGSLMSFG